MKRGVSMNLLDATPGVEYIIKNIETDDEELDSFLFTLGCYSGEPITVIQHIKAAEPLPGWPRSRHRWEHNPPSAHH